MAMDDEIMKGTLKCSSCQGAKKVTCSCGHATIIIYDIVYSYNHDIVGNKIWVKSFSLLHGIVFGHNAKLNLIHHL